MKLVLIADRQQNRICTLCRCRRDNFGIARGVVNVVTGQDHGGALVQRV